ncbi:hypothetical protein [Niastella vici]|nr:hypothetical protein [Niastella vici]
MKKNGAMENFPKISELDDFQKSRMAFLLDSETYCGYLTAAQICRGELEEYNNMTIDKIFELFDVKPKKANELARSVDNTENSDALNMTLSLTDINHLKDEFAKLGFNVENINLDERLIIINKFFQLSLTYPITDPSISAEYFSVFFSGRFIDTQKPVIEIINADLYNKGAAYKKDIQADLSYSNFNQPLPNKEQILKALATSLRFKNTAKKFGIMESGKNDIKNQIKRRKGL